ncbi:MAG: hypothetical protein K1Y02_14635, partial [Candidatus Hydrogenedentes bacterium]|nr:hypothetical protein [Candidatus Hydrogenedentota bacterium]
MRPFIYLCLIYALALPRCFAGEFVSVSLNPQKLMWAMPGARVLLNHESVLLVDGPTVVKSLPLPETFGNDEVESSWGFVPSRNEERSRWLAWVMPVPGVLRILRLSS